MAVSVRVPMSRRVTDGTRLVLLAGLQRLGRVRALVS
jgi:hypothetical protein